MVEPFATALHSVLNNFPADNETVLVFGAGTIGLCVIAALKALGSKANLLVLARHAFQAKAAEKLGASAVISGDDEYIFQEIAKHTGAKIKKLLMGKPVMVGGVHRVFECVGSTASLGNALRMAQGGGQVILVGMPGALRLDWTPISVKELTVKASWAYHHAEEFGGRKQATFEIALNLMAQGKADLGWMVTHIFDLKEYNKAFKLLINKGNSEIIKAAFKLD
jgi:L-iditol 2-dehydrogenase